MTVTNVSENGAPVNRAVLTDDLSRVLNHARFGKLPDGASLRGDTLTWRVPSLAPGESAELTYRVTLDDDAANVVIRNVVTPGAGGRCVPVPDPQARPAQVRMPPLALVGAAAFSAAAADRRVAVAAADPQVGCSTTHATPDWTLTKTSDPTSGSTVQPGSTIVYTLTVRNVSTVTVDDAVVTDDLSAVLNHATLDAVPANATRSASTLRWSVPVLAPGEVATLSYRVTLDRTAVGVSVQNVATPGRGGRCVQSCRTDHRTPPRVVPPPLIIPPPPVPPYNPPPMPPILPNTGGPGLGTAGLGLALLVAGALLTLRSSRRRS